jgi:integrase
MKTDFMRRLDFATCNAAPGEKLIKLRDGGGLYLHIKPNGRRGWRFYYTRPATKKQNTISFGSFPEVPLGDARAKCDAARVLLAKGIDPSTSNQETKRAAVIETAGAVTFLAFTNFDEKAGEIGEFWRREYVAGKRKDGGKKSAGTLRCTKIQLRALQIPLGPRPIKDIKSGEIRAILVKLCKDGHTNKAHRVFGLTVRIFDVAVTHELCDYNVALSCKKSLDEHHARKMPAVTDQLETEEIELEEAEERVGELMRRIRNVKRRTVIRKALEMMALTFPRPHNITGMLWDDIKGDLWAIGAGQMKMRKPHKVWLSRQAQEILDVMRPITGNGPRVFPVAKETLTRALVKMGYDTKPGGEQSVHGFRSIASTLLNESGQFTPDAIERQLAHKAGGKKDKEGSRAARTRGIYNKAQHRDERKEMMQFWADYLDRLRDGNVVDIKQAA